jgi:hypothetical protein
LDDGRLHTAPHAREEQERDNRETTERQQRDNRETTERQQRDNRETLEARRAGFTVMGWMMAAFTQLTEKRDKRQTKQTRLERRERQERGARTAMGSMMAAFTQPHLLPFPSVKPTPSCALFT